MTYFLGNAGSVRLRRGTDDIITYIDASIAPDDLSLSLNRVGIDEAGDSLLTGDRIDIETSDARGIDFIPATNWSTGQTEDSFSAFVNVNAAGGVRLYPTFESAVNNVRSDEIALEAFTGDPLAVRIRVRDLTFNFLGHVTNYEFNSARENIDTTSLTDKFRQQYDKGILSGSGRIDCNFDPTSTGASESSVLMLQLIQRTEIGCACDIALYLTDQSRDPNQDDIFYKLTAVITGTGITVGAQDVITCTLDFVTTGEIRLLVGQVNDYLLKEDDDRVQKEQDLGYLLTEVSD